MRLTTVHTVEVYCLILKSFKERQSPIATSTFLVDSLYNFIYEVADKLICVNWELIARECVLVVSVLGSHR